MGGANELLPKISVCIPVLNGAPRLPDCLTSLRALDYPQDLIEIVIADGGSTDGTCEVALSFGAHVLDNPGKTVAAGRNVAFAAATDCRRVTRNCPAEIIGNSESQNRIATDNIGAGAV